MASSRFGGSIVGLRFLASQQQPDGSFPTLPDAQPAVTSLCVLAFMAHGHTPGPVLTAKLGRAVKYIADCQKPNGLIMPWFRRAANRPKR